ncbi:hypothetical protein BT96DRAFT_913958 [Gymnopus androsaceus JB14]|uniref:NADH-ubiquinone oxidoreductase 12 kDa subunit n=1 Tax=Gymnopus androsaceus JB14 TaxID=1447944 RepID=A0A6A4IH14_9AGAR|nr:hypothetical protein BT96DRAFT_913958 [Gymnopus androsaceus JB14]
MAIDEEQKAAPNCKARDDYIRESWVRAMEARLVREELEKYKLLEKLNDARVQGYKKIDL